MSKEVKLVVVGDGGVGKSTLVIQYVQNMLVTDYDPTIEDTYRKQDIIGGDSAVLEILDTAGTDECYSNIREHYYRNAQGFLICFSLTSSTSLQEVANYIEQIVRVKDYGDNERLPFVLVGTKSDLIERQVTPGEIHALTSKHDIPYLETSAKLNTNVKEAFHTIAAIALESQQSELLKKNNKGQKKDVVCSIQ